MTWWGWALLGVGLLVVELLTPGGLFALFFGAGALVAAVAAVFEIPAIAQWVTFTVVSLVLLATLRHWIQEKLRRAPQAPVDSLVGEEVILLEDLTGGGVGKAELRGVPWTARVAPGIALSKGQRARVERVEGLTLWIRAE